jgi:N-hydroxyarylamine O-acetyltransferase
MIGAPLNEAELAAYCARLGIAGPFSPDLETLNRVHAAHCAAIPFENLDVQLAQPPSIDPDAIFAKVVYARRGGWCYEQNGVLGRALAAMGYAVTRISAGVVRNDTGLPAMGSHLALLVTLDRPWLVDGGFGSWIGAPLPLERGAWSLGPWPVALEPLDDGRWQLQVDLGARAMRYIFAAEPADEALLASMCHWQAHDPQSNFVLNCVVQRRQSAADLTLRGRVLTETDAQGSRQRLLDGAEDFVTVLRDRFDLDLPQVAKIWHAITVRHDTLFPDQAPPTT